MPLELALKEIADVGVGVFPGQALHIFERNEDHGVLSLIIPVFPAAFPDVAVPEINGGVLLAALEKRAEHVHVERLSESARSRKERNKRAFIQNVADQQGFVNVIVFRGCEAIIRDANGEREVALNLNILFSVCAVPDATINGLFRIGGDLP